ncbi:hypothetical protein [Legionella yabuuchiae]|uniref:hypothetical protein n=1 Tax=Legionella yabuuchiae TaxID=376727 RepID=UPI0010549684|nr:hypothetical protein [Legionella yabuuchiae]
MRVKTDKINLPNLGEMDEFGSLDAETLKANQGQLSAYMKEAREHLEAFRSIKARALPDY